jgi:BlaI family penicillinase repressor
VTRRNIKTSPEKHPSQLEGVVLDFLSSHGPATSETVREALADDHPMKDPTVRTLLRRLEAKGYVRHTEEGRAYVYEVLEQPRGLAVRALRQLLDRFCGGSVEELVTGMVEHEVIDARELRELAKKLQRQKQG